MSGLFGTVESSTFPDPNTPSFKMHTVMFSLLDKDDLNHFDQKAGRPDSPSGGLIMTNLWDPNDPNTYPSERELRFTNGTEVVLVGYPISGKSFKEWKIYDPNYPGDEGHTFLDTNSVLYLVMNDDYEVVVSWKCGSSKMMMPLGLALLMLGLGAAIRRLR